MQLRHVLTITAPADRVWTTLSDILRWPEWTPTVTNVERLDAADLGVGARFRIRQPRLMPAVWTITRWEPGACFEWRTTAPGMVATARHALRPVGAGVELELVMDFRGPLGRLVGGIVGRLTRRYMALEAEGLKAACEGAGHAA